MCSVFQVVVLRMVSKNAVLVYGFAQLLAVVRIGLAVLAVSCRRGLVLLVVGIAVRVTVLLARSKIAAAAAVVVEDSCRRHSYTLAEEVCRGAVVEVVTLMLRVVIRSLFWP